MRRCHYLHEPCFIFPNSVEGFRRTIIAECGAFAALVLTGSARHRGGRGRADTGFSELRFPFQLEEGPHRNMGDN